MRLRRPAGAYPAGGTASGRRRYFSSILTGSIGLVPHHKIGLIFQQGQARAEIGIQEEAKCVDRADLAGQRRMGGSRQVNGVEDRQAFMQIGVQHIVLGQP